MPDQAGCLHWSFVLTSLTTPVTMPRRTRSLRSSQSTSHHLRAKSSLQRSPVARSRITIVRKGSLSSLSTLSNAKNHRLTLSFACAADPHELHGILADLGELPTHGAVPKHAHEIVEMPSGS